MRILALDQASSTGWAFGTTEQTIREYQFDTWKMPRREPEERLYWLSARISARIEECKPDVLAYEEPWMPRSEDDLSHWKTIQWGLWIQSAVLITAGRHSIAVEKCRSQSWRKTLLGFAFAPDTVPKEQRSKWLKQRTVDELKARGVVVSNNDEADAIGILIHMLHGKPAQERAQGDLLDMERGAL